MQARMGYWPGQDGVLPARSGWGESVLTYSAHFRQKLLKFQQGVITYDLSIDCV